MNSPQGKRVLITIMARIYSVWISQRASRYERVEILINLIKELLQTNFKIRGNPLFIIINKMVRFEKNLYEKIFNVAFLGRARYIESPSKAYFENPYSYMRVARWQEEHNHSLLKLWYKLISPFTNWWDRNMVYAYRRDIELQRGFLPDDIELYDENELRRGLFLENVFREATHPYQHLFHHYRRMRFFKVERSVQGFHVPDYIRKESEKRTLYQAILLSRKWNDFVYMNFYSDMTPQTYHTRVIYF